MTLPEEVEPELPILARQLVRGQPTAALATVSTKGQPHCSMVLVACDYGAAPLLLISKLAIHTINVVAEPRVALMFEDCRDIENPLTGTRISVNGSLGVTREKALHRRFLNRHQEAEMYADFADFDFYRLAIESVHIVAGFGRIGTIEQKKYFFDAPVNAELVHTEMDIVHHMNADHADAIELYANQLCGAVGEGWNMTGLDAEGIDLRRGGEVLRHDFETPMAAINEARPRLISLVEQARANI